MNKKNKRIVYYVRGMNILKNMVFMGKKSKKIVNKIRSRKESKIRIKRV